MSSGCFHPKFLHSFCPSPDLGDKKARVPNISSTRLSETRFVVHLSLEPNIICQTAFAVLQALNAKGRRIYQSLNALQEFFLIILRAVKSIESPLFIRLFQSSTGQAVFIQPQIMSQLVQKSGANLLAKDFLVALGKLPDVLKKQNDLRRQRYSFFIRKFRAREQAQRV